MRHAIVAVIALGVALGATPVRAAGNALAPAAAAAQPAAVPQNPAAPTPPAPLVQAPPWDRYQVLSVNNIFSRVRGPHPQPSPPPVAASPPPPNLVLKGTMGHDRHYVAFIEDTSGGATQICKVGDSVGQAQITAIDRDGLTYKVNGQTVRVAVGDYVGGPGPARAAPSAAPAASAQPPAAQPSASAKPAAAPSGGTMSIEERLRQRRLQQEEGK